MDLIRSLLLEIEGGRVSFSTLSKETADTLGLDSNDALLREEADTLEYHLDLLREAGFAEFIELAGGYWQVERLTWKGHEFIDSIRDPEIWRQAKAGAAKVGSFTLKTIADVAVAVAKSRLEHFITTGQLN